MARRAGPRGRAGLTDAVPLYRLTRDRLAPVTPVSYAEARLTERGDLQRLLRDQIDVLDPDLLVLSEEFEDWDDSARRIDLLAVDRQANLVVVELKVTPDAGHADLQALRYAAMVSAMTFDQAADAHTRYLAARGRFGDGREALLAHLGWPAPDGQRFAPDVRVVLVSPGFSKEVTITALWLRDRGIDMRCVRALPHRVADGTLLLDVAQLVPLPEAEQFQVRVSQKAQAERAAERVQPSYEAMRARIDEIASPDERRVVDAVVGTIERAGGRWEPKPASLAAVSGTGRWRQYPLSIRPERHVMFDLNFAYLAARRPFDDEGLRRELRDRLNAIPGVDVPEDRIAKLPRVCAAAIVDPAACAAFCEVWRWVAGYSAGYAGGVGGE